MSAEPEWYEPQAAPPAETHRIFVPLTVAEIADFAKRRCKHCLGTGAQTVSLPSTQKKARVVCGCATLGLSVRDDIVEHENVICWVRVATATVATATDALLSKFDEPMLRLAIAQDPNRPIANVLGAGFSGVEILAELQRRKFHTAGIVSDGEATPKPQAKES